MTSTIVSPTFSDQTYSSMLDSARGLLARTATELLSVGELFARMLTLESADRIAADTDLSPATVVRYARVAAFWAGVRIGSDTHRRPATYPLYDRVALDPLMADDEKQEIRCHARRGRHVVLEMVDTYRSAHKGKPRYRDDLAAQAINALTHASQRMERLEPGDLSEEQIRQAHLLLATLTERLGQVAPGGVA